MLAWSGRVAPAPGGPVGRVAPGAPGAFMSFGSTLFAGSAKSFSAFASPALALSGVVFSFLSEPPQPAVAKTRPSPRHRKAAAKRVMALRTQDAGWRSVVPVVPMVIAVMAHPSLARS